MQRRSSTVTKPDAVGLHGWQALGRHVILGNLTPLTSGALSIAVLGAFIPIPGWETWSNGFVRGLIVFAATVVLLWGGLWLAYPPVSVNLDAKRLRWRGHEVDFNEVERFEIRDQQPYVRGRITTNTGDHVQMVLHGAPLAGIGRDGRALLSQVIAQSRVVVPTVSEEGLDREQLIVLNAASTMKRWRPLSRGETAFELTGVGSDEGARATVIRAHPSDEVPGVKAIRSTAMAFVVVGPVVAFFSGLFAFVPPYVEPGIFFVVFLLSVTMFAVGIWLFSVARERLERVVLERASLR